MPVTRFFIVFFFGLLRLTTVAWNCDSDFGDVASRTVRSAAVFEGRARRLLTPRHDGGAARVVFRIERVLKRNRQILGGGRRGSLRTVAVGSFQDPEDPANCVASLGAVSIGASYVVFIGNGTSDRPSAAAEETASLLAGGRGRRQQRGYSLPSSTKRKRKADIPVFGISGRPEPTSPEVVETVLRYNCSKCMRPPKSRISVADTAAKIGDRLTLHCRTSGRPDALVTWFKDGSRIAHNGQRQIRNKRRSSRLRIRSMSSLDFGVYQCLARNALGVSNVSSSTVWMKEEPSTLNPKHGVPCANQSYCINGGVCLVVPHMKLEFCQCRVGYEGDRCEIKDTGLRGVVLARNDDNGDSSANSKVFVFMIAGVMLLIFALSFVAVFILNRLRCTKGRISFKSQPSSSQSAFSRESTKDDSTAVRSTTAQ